MTFIHLIARYTYVIKPRSAAAMMTNSTVVDIVDYICFTTR